MGYSITVLEGLAFGRAKPLKGFAETLYNERLSVKKAQQEATPGSYEHRAADVKQRFIKYLLNPLYGTLSMSYYTTSTVVVSSRDLPVLREHLSIEKEEILSDQQVALSINYNTRASIDRDVLVDKGCTPFTIASLAVIMKVVGLEGDKKDNMVLAKLMQQKINISMGAAITSLSRIRLVNAANRMLDLGMDVYYVDTDSIHCTVSRRLNVPVPRTMQELRKRVSSVSTLYDTMRLPV